MDLHFTTLDLDSPCDMVVPTDICDFSFLDVAVDEMAKAVLPSIKIDLLDIDIQEGSITTTSTERSVTKPSTEGSVTKTSKDGNDTQTEVQECMEAQECMSKADLPDKENENRREIDHFESELSSSPVGSPVLVIRRTGIKRELEEEAFAQGVNMYDAVKSRKRACVLKESSQQQEFFEDSPKKRSKRKTNKKGATKHKKTQSSAKDRAVLAGLIPKKSQFISPQTSHHAVPTGDQQGSKARQTVDPQ